jgi:diguanylate cyclase (GGDEF)-like protein
VLNRRRLLELAGETFYRFRRYRRPFSILVMDLDGFKTLNETLGHQQGDAVLIEFAEVVSREKREADALGRMGGDEFCLVLPETLPCAASVLAQRVIEKCQAIKPGSGALDVSITVSIGISEIRAEDGTLDSLFSRADAALYRAKNDGRNCLKIM